MQRNKNPLDYIFPLWHLASHSKKKWEQKINSQWKCTLEHQTILGRGTTQYSVQRKASTNGSKKVSFYVCST